MFTCILCEGQAPNRENGYFIAVWDPKEISLELGGIYRIEKWPYYFDGCGITARMINDRLTWLRELPHDFRFRQYVEDGSALDYVCFACAKRMRLEAGHPRRRNWRRETERRTA